MRHSARIAGAAVALATCAALIPMSVAHADDGGLPCDGFTVLLDLHNSSGADARLHLTGTLTNSVTGRTGSYAEIQRDFPTATGTRSTGLLARVTVPGRGSYVIAGFADPDGRVTPGATDVTDTSAQLTSICRLLGP